MINKKYKLISALVFFGVIFYLGVSSWKESKIAARKKTVNKIQKLVFENINDKDLLETVQVDGSEYEISYTIDKNLSNYIRKNLKRYRSDYAAVVVIENETGKILALEGRSGAQKKWARELALASSHPCASLFKVITTADLIENSDVDSDSMFNFRGRGTTLYKYQLKPKITKWSRFLTLKKAFALSNNVVFGKAAIAKTNALNLYKTAMKFGFNKKLMKDLPIGISQVKMPRDQYNLAEMASGFNKTTLVSPVHAALFSEVISNEGKLTYPGLISEIRNKETKEVIYKFKKQSERVLSASTAKEVSEMMEYTVKRGTARSSFRRISSIMRNDYRIGGKTGSITGGLPYGKRDWFSAYAKPKDGKGSYSIAVMNINIKKWHVKSTLLAKNILKYITREEARENDKVSKTKTTKNKNFNEDV